MPEWKQEISKQLAALNLPPSREQEIIEELSVHLEDLYEEIVAGGSDTGGSLLRGSLQPKP